MMTKLKSLLRVLLPAALVAAGLVTVAVSQNFQGLIETDKLLGRDTAGTGPVEQIGVTGGIAFDGSKNITISDAELACLRDLVSAANKVPYFTGSGTCALGDFPAALRTFHTTSSSANLAALVTDETGSGSLVFGTSPSLTTPLLGVATATTINKVTITAPATGSTLTIPDGVTLTGPAASGTAMTLGNTETVTGVKTFGSPGAVGRLRVAGTTSGTTILDASAVASGTLTFPAATDTLVGKATTDTLTNKTISGSTNTITPPDNKFTLQDDADATKQGVFQLSGITTGQTRTLTWPDASTTIVGTDATQTLSNKTIGNSNTVTARDDRFTLQDDADNTKQLTFQLSGLTTATTRTVTWPDANFTVVGLDVTQTLTNKTISGSSNTLTNIGTSSFVANSVTNAKLAQMANATFKCRTTVGTGDPEDCTATQATALLNAMVGDAGSGGTKGLVPAPAAGDAAAGKYLKADGTYAVPPGSGLTDGDKGDITVSGTGSAWTIDNGVVTYAKIQNLGALALMGRSANTSGVGADIQASAGSSCAFRESSNTIGCGQLATAALANNAVTNAKLAQMANATFKCRTTAGTGDPEDCTATQSTALLNAMVGDAGSGGTKGLVPAPAAGDAAAGKYLKADGTYAVPPGGGGVADGDKGDITVSGGGTIWTVDNAAITYAKIQNLGALALMGRSANTSGVGADIQASAGSSCAFRESSNTIGCGQLATAALANNAVTNAKLAQMANATFKGRTTAGTGDPEDLTATQATALLNAMVGDAGSGGTKGLVPAPAAGDAAAGKFLKADGTFAVPQGGMVLLTSGTISSQATLDIVLTGYTGYRKIIIELINVIPVTNATQLWCRLSTNGGSSYDAAASNYTYSSVKSSDQDTLTSTNITNGAQIAFTAAQTNWLGVGNTATGGISVTVELAGQTSTTMKPRIRWRADASDGTILGNFSGSGLRAAAQDTDAIRFLMSSGNLSSGTYAVYGLQ